MHLSIVSTLYKSADHLDEFCRRIKSAAERITDDFEIILVNDGSPDQSLSLAIDFHRKDSRFRVIDLSRNFGHHRAVMTGLCYATGDFVFLIDCDLEEDPELLGDFYRKIASQNDVDVFYGVQDKRKGGVTEKLGGSLFYRTFNLVAKLQLPANPLTIRIMSKRYVCELIRHTEQELFMAGVFEITGFEQQHVVVKKGAKDETSYSFLKRVSLLVTGITSFSSFPLLFSFYIGNLISFAALVAAAYLIFRKLLNPDMIIAGWTSLMISVWFLGGVILISCGMIGLYLSKVYNEVKSRPNYIVRKIYGACEELNSSRKVK